MDERTREQIFSPLHDEGGRQRTGLGLPPPYGIIKQHGGFINVYSELGRAHLQIYLPIIRSAVAREMPAAP
jgi:nitrogen-specific signal transduction histidine kinase